MRDERSPSALAMRDANSRIARTLARDRRRRVADAFSRALSASPLPAAMGAADAFGSTTFERGWQLCSVLSQG